MKRPIVILSNFPWDYDLVHRSHELAEAWAAMGQEVYYLNRSYFFDRKKSALGVNVIELGAFPYLKGKFSFVYRINDVILKRKLMKVLAKLADPVIYLAHPIWVNAIPKGDEVVFDICDEYKEFATSRNWREQIENRFNSSLSVASKVVAVNSPLQKMAEGKKSIIVSNGVDFSDFKASKKVEKTGRVVGFVGGIFDWVDLGLVKKVAEALPNLNLWLIGPTNRNEELDEMSQEHKNIKYLGAVTRQEVASYISSIDVGIVPFVSENEYPRLKTVDSNKIYQYAFFGIPIVATDFGQSRLLRDKIHVAKNQNDFVAMVKESLTEKRNEKLVEFAKNNSWANKAKEILDFIS